MVQLRLSPTITTLAGAKRSFLAQGCTDWNVPATVIKLCEHIDANPAIRDKARAKAHVYVEGLREFAGEVEGEKVPLYRIYAREASGLQADGSMPPKTKEEEARLFTKSLVSDLEKRLAKTFRESAERQVVTKARHVNSIHNLSRRATGLPPE